MGAVVDDGTDINDLFEQLVDIGDEVEAFGSDASEASDSIDRIKESIRKGRKLGLDF
jgi:hypothetical protein